MRRLAQRSWFGLDIVDTWQKADRAMYKVKQLHRMRKFLKEKRAAEAEKAERLESAERAAIGEGKTLEELLPRSQLEALRRPIGEAGHPKFFAPLKVRSWTDQVNKSLDLKDAAEWEWREDRDTRAITWHNIETGEDKRFKPSPLVNKRDVFWRNTVGTVQEFYKERTIQGYNRKVWDHGQMRSHAGRTAPAIKAGQPGMPSAEESGDPEDPDYVGPWHEERDPQTGDVIWVRRKGKPMSGGEIVARTETKPEELMTKEEKNKAKVEEKSDELEKQMAQQRLMEMKVAKLARDRQKRRAGRRRKK